jgi:hypothetical protein
VNNYPNFHVLRTVPAIANWQAPMHRIHIKQITLNPSNISKSIGSTQFVFLRDVRSLIDRYKLTLLSLLGKILINIIEIVLTAKITAKVTEPYLRQLSFSQYF